MVRPQKRPALAQRLLVADDGFQPLQRGARHAQQVLADGQVVHAGHRQFRVGVQQVQNRRHIPGVGIFKGQHAVLGLPGGDCVEHVGPGLAGQLVGKGEDALQCDLRPGPLHPLVGGHIAAQNLPLVGPADRHGPGDEPPVIGPQRRVGDAGGVFGNDRPLPLRVKDGLAALRLALGHLRHRLHALLKQGGHLRVDGVDLGARLLQKFHGIPSGLYLV